MMTKTKCPKCKKGFTWNPLSNEMVVPKETSHSEKRLIHCTNCQAELIVWVKERTDSAKQSESKSDEESTASDSTTAKEQKTPWEPSPLVDPVTVPGGLSGGRF